MSIQDVPTESKWPQDVIYAFVEPHPERAQSCVLKFLASNMAVTLSIKKDTAGQLIRKLRSAGVTE